MALIEPVPATGGVGASRLERIGDNEAELLGEVVHPCSKGEIFRVLVAAVQHEHQRQLPPFVIGRDVESIVERPRGAAVGALQELFVELAGPLRFRRGGAGRDRRPGAKSAQNLAQPTPRRGREGGN